MVKIEEHVDKMNFIKKQAIRSKGQQRRQLMKCYHRMKKELAETYINLNQGEDIEYIKYL